MRLIIVSGQSGAGKSIALRVLEDLGYYCVDNLPVSMLEAFISSEKKTKQNVAVSIDIRNLPKEPALFTDVLERLKKNSDVSIFFLHTGSDTLLKRYSETRRIHPLTLTEDKLSLQQAIEKERELLMPLKQDADLVVDSSDLSLHELSEMIRMRVEGRERKDLVMVFESFGFKYGLPADADYVFDARFLPNPHWEPALRALTGLDDPVKLFLERQVDVVEFKSHVQNFVERWLPLLEKSNRSYLTIAIGCTGGKHRSVYLTQKIGEHFAQLGHQVQIRHTTFESNSKIS